MIAFIKLQHFVGICCRGGRIQYLQSVAGFKKSLLTVSNRIAERCWAQHIDPYRRPHMLGASGEAEVAAFVVCNGVQLSRGPRDAAVYTLEAAELGGEVCMPLHAQCMHIHTLSCFTGCVGVCMQSVSHCLLLFWHATAQLAAA